ncbi:DUF4145 domain-containing protein [Listeria aquatica]|uniref:DUF4145 domain-containing protein n=1 Tax=Listeria aquatica TaxID=1494960 RepID=UPI003EF6B978
MEFKIQTSSPSSYGALNQKKISIPSLCPNCGVSNNPSTHGLHLSQKIGFFSHYCTSCEMYHHSMQDISKEIGICKVVFPNTQPSDLPEQVVNFSPRFTQMYRDAEFAENNNAVDLAGVGYRASLEILLKDYALGFKLEDYEDIAKTNLNNAISKYFKEDSSVQIAADVVRILGNDYAHWRKDEEFDLDILKAYLNIFIQIINTKLMLKNPPVSRNKK